jgi:phage tail-like protein
MAASTEIMVGNSFFLEWGQDKIGSIQEVSGIEDETDVLELTQVTKDGKTITTKSSGANSLKVGKLTIKYAAFKGDPLRKWRETVISGKMDGTRKDVTLILYNQANEKEMEYIFRRAWPSKYAFSNLSAKSNDPLAVTVTLEHEGMSVKGFNS